MENGDKDYKKLYEEALLTISEKEEIQLLHGKLQKE